MSVMLTGGYRECLMKFSVHTALVCQLQLAPGLLISGGADGRVVLYTITPTPSTSTSTSTHHTLTTSRHMIRRSAWTLSAALTYPDLEE